MITAARFGNEVNTEIIKAASFGNEVLRDRIKLP